MNVFQRKVDWGTWLINLGIICLLQERETVLKSQFWTPYLEMDNNKGEPWDVSDAIPFTATSSQYWQQQWTSASGCWGGDDVDSDDDKQNVSVINTFIPNILIITMKMIKTKTVDIIILRIWDSCSCVTKRNMGQRTESNTPCTGRHIPKMSESKARMSS